MHLIAHCESSWLAAQALPKRRDRAIATVAGLAPDLDALTLLGGADFYGTYHHVISHNFVAAILTAVACFAAARDRARTALISVLTFHLHLLCDLAGSGSNGADWPLLYYFPVSRHEWLWSGQWNLASWQNGVIAVLASFACLGMAFPFRRTVVESSRSRSTRSSSRRCGCAFVRRG
ncbi:MAG: metal-dependent hydrolase [Myxococcales bacterium]